MAQVVFGKPGLTDGLNATQSEAVTSGEGTLAVFAGPGSGKTTVLTRRVRALLEKGVSPEQILVVTFTRAAAEEMERRIRLGITWGAGFTLGTFHSIFLRLFRRGGVPIPPLLSDRDQHQLIRTLLTAREQPADEEAVANTVSQIGYCKSNLVLPERMKVKKEKNKAFQEIFQAYESAKQERNVWDYDDILLAFCGWLKESANPLRGRYPYILVDEFQDINRVQFECLRLLLSPGGSLFAVGDDDQAIYGFRGSDPRFMLEVARRFPGAQRVILSTNYRSTDAIIAAGQKLIRHNQNRQEKELSGTGREGSEPDFIQPADEEVEARVILESLEDGVETAVLYRTSTQARAMIDALVREGIPFSVSAGDTVFYRRWQVRDILAYLRLAKDPNDLDALVRIVNKPKRYLFGEEWIDAVWSLARKRNRSVLASLPELPGLAPYRKKALTTLFRQVESLQGMKACEAVEFIRHEIGYDRFLVSYAKDLGQDPLSFTEPVEEMSVAARSFASREELLAHVEKMERVVKEKPVKPRIHLMTFHKAKGLEFDRVYLIGLHAMTIPHRRSLQGTNKRKNTAWEEERRLLYVGITRAKQELILSASRTRQGKRVGPSPFLREIGCIGGEKDSRPAPEKGEKGQPQLRFIREPLVAGATVIHRRWGEGEVLEVETLEGSAPGRKVALRFDHGMITLHYELSRQLGLIEAATTKKT
ncbi:ATP-dependent helicase [Salinithrix halophila]|uniref:DNA 3'-5' helicase n=1 Tax=Salinithrix halophila TaxID=1485204 RepID=A0ABV8JIC1_9BACL